MVQENTFSFIRFIKYVFRYCWIMVICAAVGLGLMLPGVLSAEKANYEKYIGRLTFDMMQYASLVMPQGNYSDGEFAAISTQFSQITEETRASETIAKTFERIRESIYPHMESTQAKQQAFSDLFWLSQGTNALSVTFHYNVHSDADREIAALVVQTYFDVVREVVTEKYPELAGENYDKVVVESKVLHDYNLSADILAKNKGESPVKPLLVGGVLGAALGGAVILLLYLFGTRLKSTEDILPPEKAAVIRTDRAHAVSAFLARVETAKARRIAVLTLQKDASFDAWVQELQQTLEASGAKVKTVRFSPDDTEWLTYFKEEPSETEGYELYLYNDDVNDVATYLASQAQLSAFFVDHRAVNVRAIAKGVRSVRGDSYDCTLLHNVGISYLG